ncbi:MAG: DUF2188 domain-containing protein [Pseudomarimonas sp.]
MGNNVHIVPHPEGWAVKIEGNERASSVHQTQDLAIAAGRDRARRDSTRLDRNPHSRRKRSHPRT